MSGRKSVVRDIKVMLNIAFYTPMTLLPPWPGLLACPVQAVVEILVPEAFGIFEDKVRYWFLQYCIFAIETQTLYTVGQFNLK